MRTARSPLRGVLLLPLLICALGVLPAPAGAAAGDDPLLPILHRMNRYLRQHENADGVTMDWRWSVSPSEEIRQTVVCQILAYAELHQIRPSGAIRHDLQDRADFLLTVLDDINTHAPFDGMLAHCLLAAWEVTGDPRHLAGAEVVIRDLKAIPTWQCILNGGLMVAMAMAEYHRLTGDEEAAAKAHEIVASLPDYQNADGSFPHWCYGSEDIHYTGWMSQELIVIDRLLGDPLIAPILGRTLAFLEERVGEDGKSVYEEPCPGEPGCTRYYYSRASGCWYDYDTRAWTVEPAYCALLFDTFHSPEYLPVMRFLDSLEDGGTIPDQYAYWPPPEDPEYPWTIADTSVVNMSIVFWSLATLLTGRRAAGEPAAAWDWIDDPDDGPPPATPRRAHALALGPVVPNPAGRDCTVGVALAAAGPVTLAVHDAQGREVRRLVSGLREAGEFRVVWDRRDAHGEPVRSGVYFVRLASGGQVRHARVLVLR